MRTTHRYLAALILAIPGLGLTQGAHAGRLPGGTWHTHDYYVPYAMPRYYPYGLYPWRFDHRYEHHYRGYDRYDHRYGLHRFGKREMPHYLGRRHGDRRHDGRYHERRDRDAHTGYRNDRRSHDRYAKGDRH